MNALRFDEDWHVHSTFSDGKGTLQENLNRAVVRGLSRMVCVEHVRRTTTWLPEFLHQVGLLETPPGFVLEVGVEAKVLDASGILDLPADLPDCVRVYAADHQFPLRTGCMPANKLRSQLAQGAMSELELFSTLVAATENVMLRYPGVVMAHLFSVLPKLGLSELDVPLGLIRRLAVTARNAGAIVEVDERWRCPSARTLLVFYREGVRIVASSDSHKSESVGRYDYVARTFRELSRAAGAGLFSC